MFIKRTNKCIRIPFVMAFIECYPTESFSIILRARRHFHIVAARGTCRLAHWLEMP